MVCVRNVVKHNKEFTKSPLEIRNYCAWGISYHWVGSQQTENHTSRSELVDNPFIRPEDTEMIANIRMLIQAYEGSY